jgi:signal peptidase II
MGLTRRDRVNDAKKVAMWLWLSVFVVYLDWMSKQWVVSHLAGAKMAHLSSFFNLQLVYNRGMAFGFLNQHTGWQVIVLSVLALMVCLFLLIWMFTVKKPSGFFLAALALIMGGAVGNAIDRIKNAQVTDFLDFHWAGWHFWAFNVADSAITIGVLFLLIDWVVLRNNPSA